MRITKKHFCFRLILSLAFTLIFHSGRLDAQDSIGGEAKGRAQELIKKIVQSNCSTDFFSKKHYSGGGISDPSNYYWQYKGLTWSIVTTQVSEADELNAIEFRGYLNIEARVIRSYSESPLASAPKWTAWRDFKGTKIKFHLEKKSGQWSVLSDSLTQEIGDEAPSCEELREILPGIHK